MEKKACDMRCKSATSQVLYQHTLYLMKICSPALWLIYWVRLVCLGLQSCMQLSQSNSLLLLTGRSWFSISLLPAVWPAPLTYSSSVLALMFDFTALTQQKASHFLCRLIFCHFSGVKYLTEDHKICSNWLHVTYGNVPSRGGRKRISIFQWHRAVWADTRSSQCNNNLGFFQIAASLSSYHLNIIMAMHVKCQVGLRIQLCSTSCSSLLRLLLAYFPILALVQALDPKVWG